MYGRLAITSLAAVAILTPVLSAGAQSASEWVTQGNAAYVARNAPVALRDYEKALSVDPNDYDALWRAARSQVDIAAMDTSSTERSRMYTAAEDWANRAIQIAPDSADGHFVMSETLGRLALSMGARDRIKYAGRIRDQAMECLRIRPKHAGCLHVMGVWNAEVMRLNGFTRMIARRFLGGQVFGEASWANARRYLEEAVTIEPRRIVHRLDLARVYQDMGLKSAARTEFEAVVSGELIDYNDPQYKADAADALKRM